MSPAQPPNPTQSFNDWLTDGKLQGHTQTLADEIDRLYGDTGTSAATPHGAHMALGEQLLVRKIRRHIEQLPHPKQAPKLPPPDYGAAPADQ